MQRAEPPQLPQQQYPQQPDYSAAMADYQLRDMAALEGRVQQYEEKLAAVKEMTNIFLIALVSFYTVWIPFLFYEVMAWPQATWTALSIASTAAVALLMAYVFTISSKDKQAKAELFTRRMGGQQQQQPQPQQLNWVQQYEQNSGNDIPFTGYTPIPPPPAVEPQPPMQPPMQPPPEKPKVAKKKRGPKPKYVSTRERDEFGQFIPAGEGEEK